MFIVLLIVFIIQKNLFCSVKKRRLWTSVIVFLVFYLFIVGGATCTDIYYQWDLNRYDLNKDGLFSGNEITKEQQEAMQRLTNDTGRNFSFITGLLFAFPISLMTYLIGHIYTRLKERRK